MIKAFVIISPISPLMNVKVSLLDVERVVLIHVVEVLDLNVLSLRLAIVLRNVYHLGFNVLTKVLVVILELLLVF